MKDKLNEKKLNFRSKSEAVFLELKEQILNGSIKPGDSLKQVEISINYDISRIPVRDALRRLESIGLVNIEKDRAIVISISLEKFTEVYQIRIILEDFAMEKSVLKIDNNRLKLIEGIIKEMENSKIKKSVEKWVRLDRMFHLAIYEAGEIPVSLEILTNLYNASNYTRLKYCEIPGRINLAEYEHRELFQAIKKKDVRQSRNILAKHINNSLNTILKKNKNKFFK